METYDVEAELHGMRMRLCEYSPAQNETGGRMDLEDAAWR